MARLFLSHAIYFKSLSLFFSIKKRLESFFWPRHFGGTYRSIYRSIFAIEKPWAIALFRIALIAPIHHNGVAYLLEQPRFSARINAIARGYIHVYVYIIRTERKKEAPDNLDEGATEMHKTSYPTNAASAFHRFRLCVVEHTRDTCTPNGLC